MSVAQFPLFIAEVSSNHARDLGRCLRFVDVAAETGCGAVKFQLFRIDEMFAPEILARSAKHRARKEWELPVEFLKPIADRCQQRGIGLMCTPFYLGAVRELEPYVAAFKIASYELPWDALLSACAGTGKPVILSTGMSELEEVTRAAGILRNAGPGPFTLLHTTSAYPTPVAEANLAAIATIREATGLSCGWSDHTVSPAVIMRAIFRWQATVIECHLDLDGEGAEFAAGHCWLPQQLAETIAMVRDGLKADGDGVKRPTPAEAPDRFWRTDPSDGLRPNLSVRAEWAKQPIPQAAE